jgi:hypothetical protein
VQCRLHNVRTLQFRHSQKKLGVREVKVVLIRFTSKVLRSHNIGSSQPMGSQAPEKDPCMHLTYRQQYCNKGPKCMQGCEWENIMTPAWVSLKPQLNPAVVFCKSSIAWISMVSRGCREFDEILGPDMKDLLTPVGRSVHFSPKLGVPSSRFPITGGAQPQPSQVPVQAMRCSTDGDMPVSMDIFMPWVPQETLDKPPLHKDSGSAASQLCPRGSSSVPAPGASRKLVPVDSLETPWGALAMSQIPDSRNVLYGRRADGPTKGLPPLPPLPPRKRWVALNAQPRFALQGTMLSG